MMLQQPAAFKEKTYKKLVGGIPTPPKNDGVRQLGLLFPICGMS
jgi:hypothetical protein